MPLLEASQGVSLGQLGWLHLHVREIPQLKDHKQLGAMSHSKECSGASGCWDQLCDIIEDPGPLCLFILLNLS